MAYSLGIDGFISSSPPRNSVPLTISCWFRANSVQLVNFIWLSRDDISSGWGMYLDGSGNLRGYVSSGGASDFAAPTRYSAGVWHHACLVCPSDTSRTVYIDGVGTTNSDTRSVNPANISLFRIGWDVASLNGSVADAAIWDSALELADVQALAKGASCRLVRPRGLRFYAPLIRDLND